MLCDVITIIRYTKQPLAMTRRNANTASLCNIVFACRFHSRCLLGLQCIAILFWSGHVTIVKRCRHLSLFTRFDGSHYCWVVLFTHVILSEHCCSSCVAIEKTQRALYLSFAIDVCVCVVVRPKNTRQKLVKKIPCPRTRTILTTVNCRLLAG